jgi:hypothetical protein
MTPSGLSERCPIQATPFPIDPLLCDFALPLRKVFHPFGFAVGISTNAGEVLDAAEESWGHFPCLSTESAIEAYFAVSDDCDSESSIPTFRGREHVASIIADQANFAIADLRRGFCFGWTTRNTIKRKAYFRYHFLEGAVLTILESLYLASLHSACVMSEGCGVLLCGDAGAGKSSLAFACARRGWTLISDDGSSIVRSRTDRNVVGNPSQLRFRADAPKLFPELENRTLVRGLDGELSIELPTRNLPGITTAFQANIDYVIFLNRHESGSARLLHYSPECARLRLEQTICFGDSEIRALQKASLRTILSAEVLELRYSDLESAVACLQRLISTFTKRATGTS